MFKTDQLKFVTSMGDAASSVHKYFNGNIVYITAMVNISVDCDCDAHPHAPEMGDIGIFASIDPVAVDQACYDAVMNSPDEGKAALVERMTSLHGIHTIAAAAELKLGSRDYVIVDLDQ